GLTYQKAINLVTTEVIRFGPLFELNMKPRNFFIIRASFQPDYTYNLNNQDLNEFSPIFKLKTSLQF
ncbi:MAG: hypothetical protein ABIL05_00880, partial [candidate division WOR-3 bacterium]